MGLLFVSSDTIDYITVFANICSSFGEKSFGDKVNKDRSSRTYFGCLKPQSFNGLLES